MKNTISIVLIILLGGGVAVYYFWPKEQAQIEETSPEASEERPAPEIQPQIRFPMPEFQPRTTDKEIKPLPPLEASDEAMQEELADFFSQETLAKYFHLKTIIHRFVVTIDNLPRKKIPQRYMPVQPTAGRFLTTGGKEIFFINPENYKRYAPYVLMTEAVDAKKAVAVYARFYPLFQQAYENLGYPTGYFNDRLIETIDDLLAAPDVPEPVKLVQPKVMYLYADPEIEARSAGQKLMIRIGSENAVKIKAKLREIRSELTGQLPKPQ